MKRDVVENDVPCVQYVKRHCPHRRDHACAARSDHSKKALRRQERAGVFRPVNAMLGCSEWVW